ncbi:hypothetical protein T265_07829 [Opisthorchis viverrini]|uniref:Uncharacterized protein n=1 Tax=Opisthorchis viverrini TaxID=6198 RepID=A0A074ZFU2_OPIVI|nr:hypothetical protein T265_07829 [Opisthorchis viverrini]KER24512.1 hypothetical protein T265_07829 [Opisthorchis viverrini]
MPSVDMRSFSGFGATCLAEVNHFFGISITLALQVKNSAKVHYKRPDNGFLNIGHIQWPYRGLNSGHLTCKANVLPLFHQRTLDASEFSRLNGRVCLRLSDVTEGNSSPVLPTLWYGFTKIVAPEQEDDCSNESDVNVDNTHPANPIKLRSVSTLLAMMLLKKIFAEGEVVDALQSM